MKFIITIKPSTEEELDAIVAIANSHGLSAFLREDNNLSIECNSHITFVFITSALAQYYAGV